MNQKSKIKNQKSKLSLPDKILSYLYLLLFFITPLIMFSFTSELFEFNKMIFIYLITAFVGFFWLLKMIIFKKIIIKKTPFDIPIILFLISQVLSTFFSIDRHTSIFGYYGRFNGGLLSIIAYLVLFYGFVSNIFLNGQSLGNLLKISLISSVFVILWGLPGKFGYDLSCLLFTGQFNNYCWTEQFRPAERMFSTLGQPNWLAAYLAINFFIGIYFYLKSQISDDNNQNSQFNIKKVEIISSSALLLLYLLLNFSALLFTRSRSALIAVLSALFLFIFFHVKFYLLYDRRKNSIKSLLILALGIMILIIFFKTGIDKVDRYLTISNIKNHISKINLKNQANESTDTHQVINSSAVTESFDIRKIVWRGALDLGLKYPLFGTGPETFAYSYYFVRPKDHNLTSEWDYLYNKAHNEYLNYWATTGALGLGTYLIMIGMVIFFALRQILKIKSQHHQNSESILIISLLLAYLTILVTNFFGFSTTTINLFFYLIPAFLMVKNSSNVELVKKDKLINNYKIKLSLFQRVNIFALVVLFLYLIWLIISYWYADTLYAKADHYGKTAYYQLSVNLLNQALKFKYEHVYEDKLSYSLANLAVLASQQNQKELAQKLMKVSQYYNQKSLEASPNNVLYWKTKAKNHYLFYQINLEKNDLEMAINALKKAKKLSPTDPKISYTLAIFYSLMVDESKAKEKKEDFQFLSVKMTDEAIALKPNYRDAYFLKGQLLKKYGQKAKAEQNFKFILEKINPNDQEVIKELENL